MELEKKLEFVLKFIPEVMEFLAKTQNEENLGIEFKGEKNLVTKADKGAEQIIQENLYKMFPDDGFLGEETGSVSGKNEFQWIIDPLDGTTNYSHRLPLYCISIGLYHLEKKEVLLGVIALPYFQEIYTCVKNKGAFKNKKQIFCSRTNSLENSLLVTGFPYSRNEYIDGMLKLNKEFLKNTLGVRRTGSAAIDLCWVAEGRFDGFWEEFLNPWDTSAGTLLIQEAGGQITNYSGKRFELQDKNILASNTLLHGEFLKIIQKILKE